MLIQKKKTTVKLGKANTTRETEHSGECDLSIPGMSKKQLRERFYFMLPTFESFGA